MAYYLTPHENLRQYIIKLSFGDVHENNNANKNKCNFFILIIYKTFI